MQKYLTQHGLKAFTILLPQSLNFDDKGESGFEEDYFSRAKRMILNRFADFIKSNNNSSFEHLPTFNFLTVFYDVQFVKKTDDLLKFYLVLNEPLNKTIWRRLKHTVFNQYNALIGFSDILNEVEDLDDTDRLLIQRINSNVRTMFQNTKLYMEFEQLKAFNFELKSRFISPIEYMTSFLRHRRDKEENIAFKYNPNAFKNVVLNIDNEYFKTSLRLLFDILKEVIDLSKARLEFLINEKCVWELEYTNDLAVDTEFAYEIKLINDFYNQGVDMNHMSNRMFHLIYIRLIVEKLGGEFKVMPNETPKPSLFIKWKFPFTVSEHVSDSDFKSDTLIQNVENKASIPTDQIKYPLELKREIARHFSKVEGVFVLDDWKLFANKLDILITKYKPTEVLELKQIIETIYKAINSFDVTALQLIMNKLKQISKMK